MGEKWDGNRDEMCIFVDRRSQIRNACLEAGRNEAYPFSRLEKNKRNILKTIPTPTPRLKQSYCRSIYELCPLEEPTNTIKTAA